MLQTLKGAWGQKNGHWGGGGDFSDGVRGVCFS